MKLSLLSKILLSTSVAITLLFALTGWFVVHTAERAIAGSLDHEVHTSFQAYQSLWRSRAERLASVSSILSTMSDVRAAFGTGDAGTIRDTAGELWGRISGGNAVFLITDPRGRIVASLGGASRLRFPTALPVVAQALPRFPSQSTGFLERDGRLFHLTVTPVYVQSTGGANALLDVLIAGYEVDGSVADRLKESTGGSEFLFSAGGRIVASTLPPDAAMEAGRQLSGGRARRIRAGASEYVPLVTPLADISGAPIGRLAILHSYDAAHAQIAGLQRNVALLWLFSMMAGLALTFLLARRIIEPVKALDRAAAEVARRNYDCQVPVTSQDELGRLAATFNAMCGSIRRAREELINNERIATIGRLATSIVHDLRNPLAAIYGGAEMLMDGNLSRPQADRLARNMYRASGDIHRLLEHLLNVCRGKTEEVETCSLRALAAAAADSLSAAASEQNVRIEVAIPSELAVDVERNRIERVFVNLIANALDVMPDGGAVAISAEERGGSLVVRVRDTGPGIAPEIRGRLFQPFVTARKKSGLGLGLALARQAVVDHGGDMWVEEADGRGACFSFRLRAVSARSAA